MPACQLRHGLQNKRPIRRLIPAGPVNALGDNLHIGGIKSPGGDAGRPHPHAAGDGGLFRVAGDGVFVQGDVQPVQPLLQVPARNAVAAQVHQHQVIVRAAGYQVKSLCQHSLCQGGGIFHRPPGIVPECRLHSLPEAHRLPGDHMQQRSALHTGKYGAVYSPAPLLLGQDHAAPGPPERLVGSGSHHIGVGHGTLMLPSRHQPGNVSHIHQQQRTVAVGNVRKGLKIQRSGIGRGSGHQHPGPRRPHNVLHPVIVNAPGFLIHSVADGPVKLSRLVHRRPMGQMSAPGQIHAHQGVSRLHKGRVGRQVGLGPGVRLHIGILCAEKCLGPVNSKGLYFVHKLTSAVVSPAGIPLGIFVGQAAAHGGHHRRRGDVLRGNKLNIFLLPLILPPQPCTHLLVLPSQIVHAFLQKIFQGFFSPTVRFSVRFSFRVLPTF